MPVCQGLEGVPVFRLDGPHMKYVFGEISNLYASNRNKSTLAGDFAILLSGLGSLIPLSGESPFNPRF